MREEWPRQVLEPEQIGFPLAELFLKGRVYAVPKVLYHYTSASGLVGILESENLWLSNAGFLNDPQELHHGIAVFQSAVESISECGSDRLSEFLELLLGSLDAENFKTSFVMSFCEDGDALTLWRTYGGSVGNISVGFRPEVLRKLLSISFLLPVEYNLDSQRKFATGFVSGILEAVKARA